MTTLAPPRPKIYDDDFFKPVTVWLTTTDHKLIGIMYMTTGMLAFVIGGIFALLMRIQLSQPNLTVLDSALMLSTTRIASPWPRSLRK